MKRSSQWAVAIALLGCALFGCAFKGLKFRIDDGSLDVRKNVVGPVATNIVSTGVSQ